MIIHFLLYTFLLICGFPYGVVVLEDTANVIRGVCFRASVLTVCKYVYIHIAGIFYLLSFVSNITCVPSCLMSIVCVCIIKYSCIFTGLQAQAMWSNTVMHRN